ncbi:uncharacterized protein LOC105184425 [Harpegnathos saltator]|uniref:Myb/SANT-like DNA-binding domain-containing protein n=1 Tax=Harpegnathos saltator TaxID=610380 RepID=E2BM99_HARSA|nr:uncharacterized protein LOC105184425 [Harpegnathos saltator]EFN83225.1 hypothetical protein EAI_06016 [Harpegnathos saltator]
MTDNMEPREDTIDVYTEVKVEPPTLRYAEEEQEKSFTHFENTNAVPTCVNVATWNLWTSKATSCLINRYKKYRLMVGQSTQIRSLREMFEMISLEMQNYGFYFSPQKCENKWRVLERKYKNLVFRERLKKPGRMRHYGQWEHKRAMDEIFNEISTEKKKYAYLEENGPQSASRSVTYSPNMPKLSRDQDSDRQQEDPLAPSLTSHDATINERNNETPVQRTLTVMFEKFFEELKRNFALAEQNKERRHKEKIAVRQKELELKNKLLKLKEQKMEVQKCQIIAAAQNFALNRN